MKTLLLLLCISCGTIKQTAEIPAELLVSASESVEQDKQEAFKVVESLVEPLENFSEDAELLLTYMETVEDMNNVERNEEFTRLLTHFKNK
jgi:uncharacterized protein YwgA